MPPRKLARRILAQFIYPKEKPMKLSMTHSLEAGPIATVVPIRPPTGTIEWRHNRWWARVSVPGKGRQRIKLQTFDGRDLDKQDADREYARELAAELSGSIRSKAVVTPKHRMTVRELGLDYTSGRLFQRHGSIRGLRKKKASMKSDANRLQAYVYPHIGDMAVADVREEDIEACFAAAVAGAEAKLGREWRAATKRHLYQVLHRIFDLAIRPVRIRTDNPVSDDLRPARDASKLYSFLYPDELVRLAACEKIPLMRRVSYVIGTYTGLRKGSIRHLEWDSLDFQRNLVLAEITKTQVAQYFSLSDSDIPGLVSAMVLLERYRAYLGNPRGSSLIIGNTEHSGDHEAETLREDLQLAGITRPILFKRTGNIEPIRFHDLRATFVTWAYRAGKQDGWISARTGHLSDEMLERYRRGALTIEAATIIPFPDLSEVIPELRKERMNVRLLR